MSDPARIPWASPAPIEAEPAEITALVEAVAARAGRRLAWLATGAPDWPEDEEAWCTGTPEGQATTETVRRADTALAGLPDRRTVRLAELFALTPAECDILTTTLAMRFEPSLAQVFQQLTGRVWPTEALVQRLFGRNRRPIWDPAGALARWELVEAGDAAAAEPPPLVVDPAIAAWVAGEDHLDPELARHAQALPATEPLGEWPVSSTADDVRARWERGQPVRLLVSGPSGAGRASFAAAVCRALGSSADLISPGTGGDAWPRLWCRAQRQARLTGAVPIWRGPVPAAPTSVTPAPLEAITLPPERPAAPDERTADIPVALSRPGRTQRLDLLRRLVPVSATWPESAREQLVDRTGLGLGDFARMARDGVGSAEAAQRSLRAASRGRLGDLACRLETPFDWADLIVPEGLAAGLRDFAFEARHRATYWDEAERARLFPRGRGLVALFAGPPGTGKTMAAQVVAREMGTDVVRVDLATLTSKYIGETAKNLRDLFSRAEGLDVLLLFDEADALFAGRTEVKDAHDRYANADTNYLLQLLEEFDGVAVLATNRKAGIDGAFLRRLRYVYDFPRPDAAERRRIWQALTPPILGVAADGPVAPLLDRLAENLDLSGAQIKGALLAGHFVARRRGTAVPELPDLLKGVERELVKEGRALTPSDRRRLISHD